MFFAGWLGDKITLRLAKRRNGTHIPEDSLVSLIFPTIVCAIGIAVYAVSANNPEKYSSWGIIMGEFASPPGAVEKRNREDRGDVMGWYHISRGFFVSLTRCPPFFLHRLDSPTIRLRSLHHHHHALRRGSLPKQPRPGDRPRGRSEEHRVVW